jgi:hypothetical protein
LSRREELAAQTVLRFYRVPHLALVLGVPLRE